MKIESFAMSDNEVLRALTMFVDEKWDDGMFHLKSAESIAEDGIELSDFLKSHDNSPCSLPIGDLTAWAGKYDADWIVYVLYSDGEVNGMIAITDYQG